MSEETIRRYERALVKSVRGIRLRKKVKEAFRSFLSDFMDELDVQNYDSLVTAFGPPEQMAQTFIQTLPEVPKMMGRKQRTVFVTVFCLVLVGISICGFRFYNREETALYFLEEPERLVEETLTGYVFMAEGVFGQEDVEWDQDKRLSSYVLLIKNTNQVNTKISVRYSNYRSPHVFEISPGEQIMFNVDDARHGGHTISFDSPNGTYSGTVRVFVS